MIEEVFKNYTIKLGRNQDENDELESETKRVGKELSFAGFMEFLVCFLINIIYKCLCFIILSPILTLYFYINSFCSSSSF